MALCLDYEAESVFLPPPMPSAPTIAAEVESTVIDWRLAWGVMALQASLQLGWIVYRAYQPALLSGHGFAALVLPFSLLPGWLGLVIEPISGAFSDRRATNARGRLLPITVGVLVAGLIFLGVVGLLQRGIEPGNVLLPGLMVVWMVAVQATSSPGLALLNEAASLKNLPRLAALLTLTQGLIGAFSATLARGALQLGPAFTFLLGAAVLALGLAVLRATQSPAPAGSLPQPRPAPPVPPEQGTLLLVIAVAVGGLAQVLLELLPRVQPLALQGSVLPGFTPVVLLCSALAAPWAGKLVIRWGRRGSLLRGIPAYVFSLALALLLPAGLLPPLLPLLGLIHSLVLTSLTAIALATLPPAWGGLGAGLVLGGSGLAGSLTLMGFGAGATLEAAPVLRLLALSGVVALVGSLLLEQRRPANAPPDAAPDSGSSSG
jgi:hypothetical protein